MSFAPPIRVPAFEKENLAAAEALITGADDARILYFDETRVVNRSQPYDGFKAVKQALLPDFNEQRFTHLNFQFTAATGTFADLEVTIFEVIPSQGAVVPLKKITPSGEDEVLIDTYTVPFRQGSGYAVLVTGVEQNSNPDSIDVSFGVLVSGGHTPQYVLAPSGPAL